MLIRANGMELEMAMVIMPEMVMVSNYYRLTKYVGLRKSAPSSNISSRPKKIARTDASSSKTKSKQFKKPKGLL